MPSWTGGFTKTVATEESRMKSRLYRVLFTVGTLATIVYTIGAPSWGGG